MDPDSLSPARDALLDHLPKELILARYQVARGQELISGKFANPQSSAALVANTFGFFADRPEALSLPGMTAPGEARRVDLEVQMRFPWRGGYHPWLDVGVETGDTLIGIESKRYEPFRNGRRAILCYLYAEPRAYPTVERSHRRPTKAIATSWPRSLPKCPMSSPRSPSAA